MNKLHLNYVMNFPPTDPYNICTDQVKRLNLHLSFELLSFSSQEFQFDILQDFYVIIELLLHILHCLPYFIQLFICFLFEIIQVFIHVFFSFFDYLISFYTFIWVNSENLLYFAGVIVPGFFSYFLCFFSGICTS
jgi:hypothetical protein